MNDTIAAISTPFGRGGIGIVRISGKNAVGIAAVLFRPGRRNGGIKPGTLRIGNLIDPKTGETVDQVMVTFMKGPKSYTTEDVVEINCHGGPEILKKVLSLAVEYGARTAEPGEFTKRAFMGGRIDLAQAEAVMDLIESATDRARRAAMEQLRGNLSEKIDSLREDLIDFLLQLEVRMDFCEDDIPPLSENFKTQRIEEVTKEVQALLDTFREGRILKEGLRVCITGPPNAGKSTLMNTLLGQERSIVTPVPGTTRDRIEESVSFEGIPLILMDTAGIRHSEDPVESIGIRLSIEAAENADMVILVLDASSQNGDPGQFKSFLKPGSSLAVMNKTDLGITPHTRKLEEELLPAPSAYVSLKEGTGLDSLKSGILSRVFDRDPDKTPEIILTGQRHREALEHVKESLNRAADSIRAGMADDFITVDISAALDRLGEITGKVVHQDLMDRVFSRFCIGK